MIKPVLIVASFVLAIICIVLLVENADSIGEGPLAIVFDALHFGVAAAGWETFVAGILLAGSVGLHKAAAREVGRVEKIRALAMRNFERSYQLYMAKMIMKDPDAVAWADMAWPEDRSRRPAERLRALLAKVDGACTAASAKGADSKLRT